MSAAYTEIQIELARIASKISADGLKRQRAVLEGAEIPDEPTSSLFRSYGALGVPESSGGDGGTLTDLVVFVEALSRTVEPTPIFLHFAAQQISEANGIDLHDSLKKRERWTVSFGNDPKLFIPFARDSERIMVVRDDLRIFVLDGPRGEIQKAVDPAMALSKVEVRDNEESFVRGSLVGVLRGALVLAAHNVGVARGALSAAVNYAGQRRQFGQFIGSFQGVAHSLADAFVDLESAWSLVLYASWTLTKSPVDSEQACHLAIAKASRMAIDVTEQSLQAFGGIGVTWEADAHLYIRRVLTVNSLLGGYTQHFRKAGILSLRIAKP